MIHHCAKSSKIIFDQIVSILQEIKDEDFSLPLDVFNKSTVGKHFRHILDFYNCILKGAVSGTVDYCDRDRNPTVEISPINAIDEFHLLQQNIELLDESIPLKVYTDFHFEKDKHQSLVDSSVGRELMYAYDHAIHHLAIIKIGIRGNFSYMNLDQSIGVAPSTIKYESAKHEH